MIFFFNTIKHIDRCLFNLSDIFANIQFMVPQPIRFCVVGNGQAFKKYWVKENNNTIEIVAIIGIDQKKDFANNNTELGELYFESNSHEHTINILENVKNYDAIALIVPTQVKLNLLSQILSSNKLTTKKIFIEKPYAETQEELEQYLKIIEKNNQRVHLASKYSMGRANILYENLIKKNGLPTKIICKMIEGSEYFNKLSPQYLVDGPELDIGFHMIDIVAKYCIYKFGSYENIEVDERSVKDLSEIDPRFIKNFGFFAIIKFVIKNITELYVELSVGKADCTSERNVSFVFSDEIIEQEYTIQNSDDPVYANKKLIAIHPEKYSYYMRELQSDKFCKQTIIEQKSNLEVNKICLKIKQIRTNNYS